MITNRELRTISLEFRRLSSNLLCSDRENADVRLYRFMDYIENTPCIHDLIHDIVDNTDFDFNDCFRSDGYWIAINTPMSEKEHVKAQYDYMYFILNEEKRSVSGEAFHYPHTDKSWSDIVQNFLSDAVKPLIDFINDAISKEMIVNEEEAKKNMPQMNQSIGTVNGNVIQQASGSIVTSTVNNNQLVQNIEELIGKILESIDMIQDIDADDLESVKDDLESVEEQVKSAEPKKSRIQKALTGIRRFANDFSMKLGVSVAASAVTRMDWSALVQQIEAFLQAIAK